MGRQPLWVAANCSFAPHNTSLDPKSPGIHQAPATPHSQPWALPLGRAVRRGRGAELIAGAGRVGEMQRARWGGIRQPLQAAVHAWRDVSARLLPAESC